MSEKKKVKKTPLWIMRGVVQWIKLAYIHFAYKVYYSARDNEEGVFYLKKRVLFWLIVAPLCLPFEILGAIGLYFLQSGRRFEGHGICSNRPNVSFKEKLYLKWRLRH